jgi:hypothetical protein
MMGVGAASEPGSSDIKNTRLGRDMHRKRGLDSLQARLSMQAKIGGHDIASMGLLLGSAFQCL